MKRLILNIILLAVIITCPWWVSVLLALALLYYLKHFNEIILYGFIMDILYGKGDYKFTVIFLILLLSSFFIKKRLKFYSG